MMAATLDLYRSQPRFVRTYILAFVRTKPRPAELSGFMCA